MVEQFVMILTPSMEKFIAGWAEMASKWCVNRTVAEVHALFYLSPEPLSAEDVSRTLSVSRSNVSASLRELEARELIRPVHIRGDKTNVLWETHRRSGARRRRRLASRDRNTACQGQADDAQKQVTAGSTQPGSNIREQLASEKSDCEAGCPGQLGYLGLRNLATV